MKIHTKNKKKGDDLGPEIIVISKKYEDILYVPGEDLNIERNVCKILLKCWTNIILYPRIKDIVSVTNISERTLFRYADKYKWPKREKSQATIVNMFNQPAMSNETN